MPGLEGYMHTVGEGRRAIAQSLLAGTAEEYAYLCGSGTRQDGPGPLGFVLGKENADGAAARTF